MNDPFVEELHYSLKPSKQISFKNPPDIVEDFKIFKIVLSKDTLVVYMIDQCKTEEQARTLVEPHLRAWELDNFLTQGHMEFRFEFIESKIIDRNPSPKECSKVLHAQVGEYVIISDEITFHKTRGNYPLPPRSLLFSPDVESLLRRYEGFLNGNEPILSMAYFCLSLIESSEKKRKSAAHKYNIDSSILYLMGDLTSERGDRTEARKIVREIKYTPLTDIEKTWIQETIKILIRRKAEYDFDPGAELIYINLNSLPPITLSGTRTRAY